MKIYIWTHVAYLFVEPIVHCTTVHSKSNNYILDIKISVYFGLSVSNNQLSWY